MSATKGSPSQSFSKKLLHLMKPAPFQKEIEDAQEVHSLFGYWRMRIFYSMYIGYAIFYFSRKSFTFAMPYLMNDLFFTKTQLGILGSIFSITYGVSKFASGIFGDKSNPRYFMSIGLILTGIFNIGFGLSSTLAAFALFWGLNGWFQGWGWPGCAKLLTHWYSHSERGTWWSFWNTSHNLGGAMIPYIVSSVSYHFGWRYGMYVPGVICILTGLYLIDRLRDTPQSLGLPTIEKYRNDQAELKNKEKSELSAKELLLRYVLTNRYVWVLAIAYFFVYVIRTAVNDWTFLYFTTERGYTAKAAGTMIFAFELGGLVGSLLAGVSSDYFFKGKRNPINFLYSLGMIVFLYIFGHYAHDFFYMNFFLVFMIGFLVFGPQMMIGIAAAELSHKKAAATATGFAGTFGYLGAATAGYPLGYLIQSSGWDVYHAALVGCAFMTTLLVLPLWSVTTREKMSSKR